MALATLPVIEGLTPRVQEIGRIRMGEKNDRGLPTRLKTFRLTSNDRKVLEAAVALYGGRVEAWTDAPDEGMWQVTTAASELDILIPRALRTVSQAWELWQGGTCERRCDGRTEELTGEACLCGDARGSSKDVCDIVTRLSVILPRLPGLGVWRLDTGGWNAAQTIPSTLDLLLALDPRAMVPATLRAVQASSKVRDPKTGKVETHRFVRAQLDAPGITIGQLVGAAAEPVPLLDAGERPALPTAEERVARQRQEVEARRAAEAGVTEPVGLAPSQDAQAEAAALFPAADTDSGDADPAAPGPSEAVTSLRMVLSAALDEGPAPETPATDAEKATVAAAFASFGTQQAVRQTAFAAGISALGWGLLTSAQAVAIARAHKELGDAAFREAWTGLGAG